MTWQILAEAKKLGKTDQRNNADRYQSMIVLYIIYHKSYHQHGFTLSLRSNWSLNPFANYASCSYEQISHWQKEFDSFEIFKMDPTDETNICHDKILCLDFDKTILVFSNNTERWLGKKTNLQWGHIKT